MHLSDRIEVNFRLDDGQKKALKRLGLFSIADLLYFFPVRYSDMSEVKKISELYIGDTATVYGQISKLKTKKAFKTKIPMAEGQLTDLSGKIKVTWFNQAYLAKMLKDGDTVKLTGKVTDSKHGIYLANPEFEKTPDMPIDTHESLFKTDTGKEEGFAYPIYHETRGITSKWIYHAIIKIIKERALDDMIDYIPKDILDKYNLPSLKTSLIWIHTPKNKKDAMSARKRFAFEEIFFIQLERQHDKLEFQKNKSFQIKHNDKETREFLDSFPFKPTKAQERAIKTILDDMSKNYPMSRLLEGDVGSGKTLVSATASYTTVMNSPTGSGIGHLQVAYMVPTEILATQHFESFIKYFENKNIQIGLITGSGCRKFPSKVFQGRMLGKEKSEGAFATEDVSLPLPWTQISRSQLLKWVANGEIPILIGTHALIQKTVKFKNLALAIIDEQHRFGTAQRKKLVRKDGVAPHLLSMTATPIPRTLALTIYGDLDLSLLDEMPQGRKQIITEIISPDKRAKVYEEIKKELKAGRQLYVICPRIFEPDPEKEMALNVKSAVAEAKRLKKEVFQEYEIDVMHSKMSKQKKEEVMNDFASGKTDILCATSVVEVGVNVPNATIIIIEGAERFGLAQLHQLRGRVIRSSHQAYCYVFADAKTDKTMDRLNALKNAKNGFELAELDLTLRGAGELSGTKQWGMSDLAMEAIKNIKMVEIAREEAKLMIQKDPELLKHPALKEQVKKKVSEFHFE